MEDPEGPSTSEDAVPEFGEDWHFEPTFPVDIDVDTIQFSNPMLATAAPRGAEIISEGEADTRSLGFTDRVTWAVGATWLGGNLFFLLYGLRRGWFQLFDPRVKKPRSLGRILNGLLPKRGNRLAAAVVAVSSFEALFWFVRGRKDYLNTVIATAALPTHWLANSKRFKGRQGLAVALGYPIFFAPLYAAFAYNVGGVREFVGVPDVDPDIKAKLASLQESAS